MNKSDLIDVVVKGAGINRTQADTAISSFLSGIEGDRKMAA